MATIALLTDFGLRDWYVGTMKAVILSINPTVQIVDVTHEIPSGNIMAGAFALSASCSYFPQGTVFLAVVDPGVGSDRKAIAVKTDRYCFVGPDNGLFSLALENALVVEMRLLDNRSLFLPNTSASFHGRDIFAPVAARLAGGADMAQLGSLATSYEKLEWCLPIVERHKIQGKVVYIDHFGNAITNIVASKYLDSLVLSSRNCNSTNLKITLAPEKVIPFVSHYNAVKPNTPLALIGSHGFLEIALNGGSAAILLKLQPGSMVQVEWPGRCVSGESGQGNPASNV
jgi:S-adenosylmethionine hydrolase